MISDDFTELLILLILQKQGFDHLTLSSISEILTKRKFTFLKCYIPYKSIHDIVFVNDFGLISVFMLGEMTPYPCQLLPTPWSQEWAFGHGLDNCSIPAPCPVSKGQTHEGLIQCRVNQNSSTGMRYKDAGMGYGPLFFQKEDCQLWGFFPITWRGYSYDRWE